MFFSGLERAILEVVVYFDIFSHSLTALEIWKNLRMPASYGEVVETLESSAWLKVRIQDKDGMWSLVPPPSGGAPPLGGGKSERAARYRISKYKLDIAQRFARVARFIPGLVGIYACNTLGFLASRRKSDIDFFIVARRGRIWTVRFFAVLLAKLFFRRPHGAHSQNAICLSFFATMGANLNKLALPGGDVYYEYWLKNLLPLWERGRPPLRGGRPPLSGGIEKILRFIQLKIMPARLKELAGKGTSVVLSDEFLKFHDHDRREYYQTEFARRFAEVCG